MVSFFYEVDIFSVRACELEYKYATMSVIINFLKQEEIFPLYSFCVFHLSSPYVETYY